MRSIHDGSVATSLLIACLATSVAAEGSFLHLPLTQSHRAASGSGIARRANATLNVKDTLDLYTTQVGIGSPAQQITLEVDTGCSALWVNPDCQTTGLITGSSQACQAGGAYDPSKSSTAVRSNRTTDYSLNYPPFPGDVTLADARDTFTIGETTLPSQSFRIATASQNETYGRLGLGPDPSTGFARKNRSTSLLTSLASTAAINSRVYSLNLRSLDDSNPADTNGSLILGGVDKAKFQGALTKLPILPPTQAPVKFYANWVKLDSLGGYIPPNEFSAHFGLPQNLPNNASGTGALLDSTVPFIGLPANVTAAVMQDLPVTPDTAADGTPLTSVDCGLAGSDAVLIFGFGNLQLSVLFSDMVVDGSLFGRQGKCYLMLYPSDVPILGSPFLRSAYTVYDHDNQNIYVARAASCGEQIVEVGSGPSALEGIAGICTPAPERFAKFASIR